MFDKHVYNLTKKLQEALVHDTELIDKTRHLSHNYMVIMFYN